MVGSGKLWVGFASMQEFSVLDPLLGIKFRYMMQAAGVVEVSIALLCVILCQKALQKTLLLIAWLATSLLVYRFGLWIMGWKQPCNCMGYLTDVIHVSPRAADFIMKIILGWMLLGSYAALFWLWRQKRNAPHMHPSSENSIGSAS